MNFLHPEILYSLILLAIPMVIHLFHFRKFRPVYFSQITFLKELKQESNTRNKLREWVLLLLRLLAIACIIIVFAWPYIPQRDQTRHSSNSVSIYIDNSFSTEAENEQGKIIDLEKNIARDIITSYNESDEFQILANDSESKNLKFYDKETALKLIDEIEISPAHLSFAEIQQMHIQAQKNHAKFPGTQFILSDFQKNQFLLNKFQDSKSGNLIFVPIANQKKQNISIQHAYLTKPLMNLSDQVYMNVVLKNHSNEDYNGLSLKLKDNGQVKVSRTIDIEGKDSLSISLSFPKEKDNYQDISLEINDSPILYDNQFFISFKGNKKLKVAYIYNEKHSYFEKLFRQSEFDFSAFSKNQIPYSELNKYDFILLDELSSFNSGLIASLKEAYQSNSNICIVPGENAELNTYNQLLLEMDIQAQYGKLDNEALNVQNLNFDHPLFTDVFKSQDKHIHKPSVKSYYPIITTGVNRGESVLNLENGENLIWANTYESNYIFLLGTSLSSASNLEQHALFVPAFYNMSFLKDQSQQLYYTLGEDKLIRLPGQSSAEKMILNGETQNYYPTFKQTEKGFHIALNNSFSKEGIYALDQGTETITHLAFNYPRKESELDYYSKDELQQFISNKPETNIRLMTLSTGSISGEIEKQISGKILWPYFLALSLLFLIFEIALIKFRPYENSHS